MPFSLSLLGKETSGIVHLAAHGDAQTTDFMPSRLPHFDALLGPQWAASRIVLNMDNVPSLVSAAIGWLPTSQKQCREAGGMLVLHSVQPTVLNILHLLKVERVIPIGADEKAAVALARGKRKAAEKAA